MNPVHIVTHSPSRPILISAPIYLWFYLFVPSLQVFITKYLRFSIRATRSAHNLLHLIAVIFGEVHCYESFSILLLFPSPKYTSQQFFSTNLKYQVPQIHKTTGKVVIFCILILEILDMRREDKRLWNELQQTYLEFNVPLTSSWRLDFLTVSPKYLNLSMSSKDFIR
jgi:hypothetical protein